jgi:hypothetical protein
MDSSPTQTAAGQEKNPGNHDKTVTVTVNNIAVVLPKDKMTGAEIKAAAIAAEVHIEPNFVLSVSKHGDRYEVVGDDDVITVHEGLAFTAVDADDNS